MSRQRGSAQHLFGHRVHSSGASGRYRGVGCVDCWQCEHAITNKDDWLTANDFNASGIVAVWLCLQLRDIAWGDTQWWLRSVSGVAVSGRAERWKVARNYTATRGNSYTRGTSVFFEEFLCFATLNRRRRRWPLLRAERDESRRSGHT